MQHERPCSSYHCDYDLNVEEKQQPQHGEGNQVKKKLLQSLLLLHLQLNERLNMRIHEGKKMYQ